MCPHTTTYHYSDSSIFTHKHTHTLPTHKLPSLSPIDFPFLRSDLAPFYLVCARLSPPPSLTLSFNITPRSRFIRCNKQLVQVFDHITHESPFQWVTEKISLPRHVRGEFGHDVLRQKGKPKYSHVSFLFCLTERKISEKNRNEF